jgi:LCP family protein required for cell wall assembly
MTTGGGGPWGPGGNGSGGAGFNGTDPQGTGAHGGANESDFDSLFGPGSAATASAEAYDYDALTEEREAEKRRRRRGSSRGAGGSSRITRRSTRKTTGRKVLAGFLVLLLLLIAAIAAYVFFLASLWNGNSNQLGEDEVFGGEQPVATSDVNILLLGSDARDEDVDYAGDARGNRSDTIMVMHIDGDREGVQIMSIPRDSWVDIEGHGKAKINAAMSFGGLPLATQTISDFIGAPIHHVAIMDFEGFKALTDSVGGVVVDSEQEFEIDGHTYTEGANELSGEEALPFVRARKMFADGDLQRIRNQQAFLTGLMDEIIAADTLGNPAKVAGMVRDFSPYMTVELRGMRSGDVKFFSAPISGAGTSSDGQAILNIDEEKHAQIQDAFENDTVAEYAQEAETVHL